MDHKHDNLILQGSMGGGLYTEVHDAQEEQLRLSPGCPSPV